MWIGISETPSLCGVIGPIDRSASLVIRHDPAEQLRMAISGLPWGHPRQDGLERQLKNVAGTPFEIKIFIAVKDTTSWVIISELHEYHSYAFIVVIDSSYRSHTETRGQTDEGFETQHIFKRPHKSHLQPQHL